MKNGIGCMKPPRMVRIEECVEHCLILRIVAVAHGMLCICQLMKQGVESVPPSVSQRIPRIGCGVEGGMIGILPSMQGCMVSSFLAVLGSIIRSLAVVEVPMPRGIDMEGGVIRVLAGMEACVGGISLGMEGRVFSGLSCAKLR